MTLNIPFRMNPFRWAGIALFIGANGISNVVMAQVDAGALQQNLEKQLPLPSPLALPEAQKPSSPQRESAAKAGEVRFTVNSFVLEGVKTLPEAKVQETLKAWVGKSVNFDDLQKACDAVVELYRKNGMTVQAILPPQKIDSGVVKILITEAKLSEVIVDTPQGDTRFGKQRAAEYITYANPIGAPLNMDRLERALIILNETPGVMVASQLEPGKNDGETAVRVQLTEPPVGAGRVELNNYGSRTTGANQGVIALNANNVTGIGDQAALNGIYSEGSQYIQGAYSIPGSKDGLRLGVAGTYLNYKNVSNYASPNGGWGDSWTAGLSAAYPLIRSQATNLNATMNYDVKSYMNKNQATQYVISSYNINNFSIGMSGNHYDGFGGGGISTGSVSLVFGYLDILGTSTPGYGAYTPPGFTKFAVSGSRNQQLTEDGLTSFYIAASGQMASVNLNSAEQFYLGGPYGVRAYPVAQAGGSQGGLATAELRRQLPQNVTISAFFDAGVVQQYKNVYPGWQGLTHANNTYSLMGAGLGVKWMYGGWNVSGSVAWKVGNNPLYNQYGQAVNTDGTTTNPRGWVTASYTF
ncbi:MAG: ShlB/FhaC/HecB family hemolysin secretion/activation protein [Polynucleobacter sp.]|uniref:ShlB/FhaC/HecB family hemolysin secretion/activation protein n=1 Tax=Polynucleobacter sp. TaxID=2029855 RepID=UPI00216B7AA6|nr:ShlB/FhaC/HecB family hemolysin secretion/activation protein [Polynucleobacter sp.]MBU3670302.1 ShlB/FhaC/HecB family hemolysin secretion/activation protein [Polynucleobacter sp.]